VVCRERKTKCDGERPVCGFCRIRGGSCRYAESDASKLDPGSLEVLSRIGQLELSLKSYISDILDLRATIPESSSATPSDHPQTQPASHRAEPITQSELPRDQFHHQSLQSNILTASAHSDYLQTDNNTLSGDGPPSTEIISHASDMSLEAVLKWPIFTDIAPYLSPDLHTSTMEVLAKTSPIMTVAEKDIDKELQNLTSQRLDSLVKRFLANNHIKNPVIDVGRLRSYADDFKRLGPQWDGATCFVVRFSRCLS
jgi:hypothetical protein